MDLALNNLQGLLCHKTQTTKPNQTILLIGKLCQDLNDNLNPPGCWNVVEHEGDDDIDCRFSTWKETVWSRDQRKNGDHSDHRTAKIIWNTSKSPGDLLSHRFYESPPIVTAVKNSQRVKRIWDRTTILQHSMAIAIYIYIYRERERGGVVSWLAGWLGFMPYQLLLVI